MQDPGVFNAPGADRHGTTLAWQGDPAEIGRTQAACVDRAALEEIGSG